MSFLTGLFGTRVPALGSSELQEKLKNGKRPYLLDVRQPEEYRNAHIVRARLIPLSELSGRLKELPADGEIICICQTGSRSLAATRTLLAAGYNAINLEGGMTAWQQAKFPIKKDAMP